MRFIRVITTSTPPRTASAPPASPVPDPRGTIGVPCAVATRTTAATSSAEHGKTTTSGSARSIVASYS